MLDLQVEDYLGCCIIKITHGNVTPHEVHSYNMYLDEKQHQVVYS